MSITISTWQVPHPMQTGQVMRTNCTPGTNSTDVQAKVLMRINYFRKLAGLTDTIKFDPVKNAKCLEAALIMTSKRKNK